MVSSSTPPPAATVYEIDGFRSLIDFHISLERGLNVLVGPNGSGKTNFLDFLGFLDSTVHGSATGAISASGGIARVFSQERVRRTSASLSAKVSGIADLRDAVSSRDVSLPLFRYEYDIRISFSRTLSAVYISREAVRLWKLSESGLDSASTQLVGTIALTRRSPSEDMQPRWQITKRLFAESPRNPLSVSDGIYRGTERPSVLQRLGNILLGVDESFLSAASRYSFPALEAVRSSITRGRSFNIAPDRSRMPDDISKPPGIMRDGSGLTATLHNLQAMRGRRGARRVTRLRRASPATIVEILEWTKLIFPEMSEIRIVEDPHTGKYLGYLLVGDGKQPLHVPFQSASDGTLKWLSLVTLVLTSGGAYSIEEPENFLHPKMQQFLVQIIRDNLPGYTGHGYFIFSTHSETLINYCRPSELIVFDFEEGKTVCSRIENPDRVLAEINRTGFGLGYYYASNALPARPRLRRGNDGKVVHK
jgi:predicted ATPase